MSRLILLLYIAVAAAGTAVAQAPGNCPTIDVSGPAGIVQPPEKFVFTGKLEGNMPKNASFQWEVSGGKIVDGQGTLQISVDAEWRSDGATIHATLNLLGLPEGCPKTAFTVSGFISCPHYPTLIDEFGKRTNSDIRTSLKAFITELQSNPTNQGYIILYGTEREMTVRERLIRNDISARGFDPNRITLVRGGTHPSGTVFTRLYRVPPGADNPTP